MFVLNLRRSGKTGVVKCAKCGKEFKQSTPEHKFCEKSCTLRYHNEKRSQRRSKAKSGRSTQLVDTTDG